MFRKKNSLNLKKWDIVLEKAGKCWRHLAVFVFCIKN